VKVVVVLGYSNGRTEGLHPICAARLQRAVAEAADADAVVLTGHGRRPGALPEAELMRAAWRGRSTRLVCDPTARITAENAARVAALVRDLGATEVVVVTSWWHSVRARLFFHALLGRRRTRLRVIATARPWSPWLLARELAAFVLLPLQIQRARGSR